MIFDKQNLCLTAVAIIAASFPMSGSKAERSLFWQDTIANSHSDQSTAQPENTETEPNASVNAKQDMAFAHTAQASDDVFVIPENQSVDERGVNLSSGLPTMRIVEVSIGGDGATLQHARHFGVEPENGINCDAEQNFCTVYVEGVGNTFEYESGAIWSNENLTGGQLRGSMYGSDGFSYLDSKGAEHKFLPNTSLYMSDPRYMRLISSKYPNGIIVTYNYVPIGSHYRLQSVTNNLGYQIFYEYQGEYDSFGRLNVNPSRVIGLNNAFTICYNQSEGCSPTQGVWPQISSTYDYQGSTQNASVVKETVSNSSGQVSIYSYLDTRWSEGTNARVLSKIEEGNERRIVYQITNAQPVYEAGVYTNNFTRTLNGATGEWNYTFLRSRGYNNIVPIGATISGPSGESKKVYFNIRGSVGHVVGFNGGSTTFGYDFVHDGWTLVEAIKPEGERVEFSKDERGNVVRTRFFPKPGSGIPMAETSAEYPTSGHVEYPAGGYICNNWVTCNSPLSKTDANGQTTTFSYDQIHGGVLKETGPMVGGVAPVNRYVYVQRRAWVLNEQGGFAPMSPIWVLHEKRTCKTTVTTGDSCMTASDEVVTYYDYGPDSGPNNLNLRGVVVVADGQTSRTCYGYDKKGNRVSETSPQADLAFCP